MRFYGEGKLCYPRSERVIWDFKDGPFCTLNTVIIEHLIKKGYKRTPPVEPSKSEGKQPKEEKSASKKEASTV